MRNVLDEETGEECIDCHRRFKAGFAFPGQRRCFGCAMLVLDQWWGKPEDSSSAPTREEGEDAR